MTIENLLPASGAIKDGVFFYPIRIYYEDTDAGGIVYYANYLKFAERTRTEFIRSLGCSQVEDLQSEDKCGFVVRHVDIEYKKPAILDDALVVTCKLVEAKGAGATMQQEIYRGDELLVKMEIKVA